MFSGPAHLVNIVLESYCKRRKIRFIEGNAKCHLKDKPVKGLCGRCLSVWGPEPHNPPPLTHCIRVYNILIHTEKGGMGQSWTRKKGWEGQQLKRLGRKLQHEHEHKLWQTPTAKSLYRSIFYMVTFCFGVYKVK